ENRSRPHEEPCLRMGFVPRDADLNPAVEIAAHQVGGAEVDLEGQARSGRRVRRRPPETVDAGVLEETADDGANANVLRQFGNPGAEAAQTTDGEVDLHTGTRG